MARIAGNEASVAKPAAGAKAAPSRRKFGLADFGRLTLWAFCAAFAVTIAAYAGTTKVGQDRIKVASGEIHEIFFSSGIARPKPLDVQDGQRLADSVKILTADRDRLLARVATFERNLGEVTGSIARVEKATREVQTAQQAMVAAAPPPRPQAVPPAEEVTASINQPNANVPNVPIPPPAPGRGEYGLDLGSAPNVEGLRTLWATTLRRYSTLFEGLRPVVQMRERRPGGVDLHLVVGPIPNAATAARLCATITAAGAICQPSSYDGQRLALR